MIRLFASLLFVTALSAADLVITMDASRRIIENASYGLTVCAERVAIAADSKRPTPPCGACRQILSEFAPEATITLVNLQGQTREFTVAELLPESFNDSFLS